MKRHGLWQFHKALKQSKSPMRWWIDDEIQRCGNYVAMVTGQSYGGGFIGEPWRKADILIRCAFRYIRRYKLSKTIDTWNVVVQIIAKRCGAHRNSINAATIAKSDYREKSPLQWRSEFALPCPRFSKYWIVMRHERIKKMQQQRAAEKAKYCCICKKPHTGGIWLNVNASNLLELDSILHRLTPYGRFQLCWSCGMKYSKLCKRAVEADATRLAINRQKRNINEITKNNGRTERGAGQHICGSN